jgi:hypothetical protein
MRPKREKHQVSQREIPEYAKTEHHCHTHRWAVRATLRACRLLRRCSNRCRVSGGNLALTGNHGWWRNPSSFISMRIMATMENSLHSVFAPELIGNSGPIDSLLRSCKVVCDLRVGHLPPIPRPARIIFPPLNPSRRLASKQRYPLDRIAQVSLNYLHPNSRSREPPIGQGALLAPAPLRRGTPRRQTRDLKNRVTRCHTPRCLWPYWPPA